MTPRGKQLQMMNKADKSNLIPKIQKRKGVHVPRISVEEVPAVVVLVVVEHGERPERVPAILAFAHEGGADDGEAEGVEEDDGDGTGLE